MHRMHVQVAAAEVLLGVMEGLHVDNARIEFEGACEVRAACCVLRAVCCVLLRLEWRPFTALTQ